MHDALRAGASGFLLKDVLAADLLAAVKVVAAGEALLLLDKLVARGRVQLSAHDEVAIAPRPIEAGTVLSRGADVPDLTVRQDIPRSHKVALTSVARGEQLHKYGQSIGGVTADIRAGDHVHSHNLGMDDAARAHEFGTARSTLPVPADPVPTFLGYPVLTDASAPGTTSGS